MHDNTQQTIRVAVVGGGVAGLATAFLIRELGRASGRMADVTIFEAQSDTGGATRTDFVDGYTCEWGPNGFLNNEPTTFDLAERLGLTDHLLKANPSSSHRFIYHTGKLREVPLSPPAFLTSDILPLSSKIRMAMEILVPAKRNGAEESVSSFGRRRLGKDFATYLLDPMVSGIFAGKADELSLSAVFPKMVSMEQQYGGLFRAMFAMQKQAKQSGKKVGGPAGAGSVLHTFRNGMGELTGALSRELASALRTANPVTLLARKGKAWMVVTSNQRIESDAVVMACPAYAAAKIIADLDPDAASHLDAIYHAPVDVVCHGYVKSEIEHPMNGFGVLVPRVEGIRSLGCLWSDSIFSGQAPDDRHLVRTIIGGAHDPDVVRLSEDDLQKVAFRDNQRLLGIRKPPVFRKVYRHPRGIAQYTIGHSQRIAVLDKLERQMPGLYFTGASYRGVSVNGCVKDANRVAQAFWTRFGERP